jgi:uncharacterized protein YndB with AHSA1/START domain
MGHIEATRDLSAAPEALWGTVTDLANWDKWFTVHEKWLEDPPATLTEGTKLTAKIVMLGMANKIGWTIDSVEAPRQLVLSGTGMAGVKAQFTFVIEPIESGSRFSVRRWRRTASSNWTRRWTSSTRWPRPRLR